MNVKQLAFSIAILICVTVLAVLSVRNKLTYLEYSDITPTQHSMNYVTVNNSREVLLQEFVMPYDIVHGMAIQIGTFGRDNNSEWDAAIINPETKEIYGSKHFSGSQIADNSYRFIEFDRNIRLTRNTRYQIRISARRVNSDTLLAFYVSKRANEGLSLTIGNINYDGTLCVKIYGGDSDDWWMGFVLAVSIIFWGLIVRIVFICETRKIHWIHDPVVKGYIVGIVSFLLLFSFCNYRQFLDETDNMLGGWVIAHGGVLHRDYVTQHPPFAYYLCGVFALLGAKSVEQFRLLFYLLMSAIWGLLYIRHEKQFGKKMFFLPILECTVINSMSFHPSQHAGCMVLSDGIQAICFIALLLEFLKFRRDHNLNWGRAFIVSVCVWASVGSAFLSVYALAWVALAFFVVELKKCTGENFCSSQFFYRYGKLLTAFVFPPLLAIAYFSLNNSLSRAFEQFYTFNREVYCHYSGLGKNIIEPFILSFRSVFDVLKDNINETINARASTTIVVQLLVLLVTLPVLYFGLLRKKQYLNFAVFCGVLFFLGVRGNRNYHFLAAWCMAVMIITLFYDQLFNLKSKVVAVISVIVFSYCSSTFIHDVGDNLLRDQKSVSGFEHYMVSVTDDNEKIIFDSVTCGLDSGQCNALYLLYKNRHIVNRVQYMLPWYMDWYEQDTIDDLLVNKPRYVVFSNQWGKFQNFATIFNTTLLKQSYKKLSDNPKDGWKYYIWKTNELK